MVDAFDEFASAKHIEKLHRYLVTRDGTVRFGLLAADGTIDYFEAASPALTNISMETFNLARMGRLMAHTGDIAGFQSTSLYGLKTRGPDGMFLPFDGPGLKVLRAIEHLERLAHMMEDYAGRARLEAVEIERDGQLVTWELKLTLPPPDAIPLMIGDIVHNLRSALDIMVCDVARLRGRDTHQFKFPFAKDKDALEKIFKLETRKIGDDVCAAIKKLNPVIGGNYPLRSLHDLDVLDKHRLIIPVYFTQWQKHDSTRRLNDLLRKNHPNSNPPQGLVFDDPYTPLSAGERIQVESGEDPLEYYEPMAKMVEARFPNIDDMPFTGQPVLQVLWDAAQMVHEIIEDFQSQFGEAV